LLFINSLIVCVGHTHKGEAEELCGEAYIEGLHHILLAIHNVRVAGVEIIEQLATLQLQQRPSHNKEQGAEEA
jgi:hypothetical protein